MVDTLACRWFLRHFKAIRAPDRHLMEHGSWKQTVGSLLPQGRAQVPCAGTMPVTFSVRHVPSLGYF